MSKLFYPKMAATNMKKNSKFYLPYILTCIFTIMMFYNMCSIASHQGLKEVPGSATVTSMMGLGCIVIGIFAVIFLFYTNNFLMRRRKKEIGLYYILGMEKRHITKILFFEMIYTALISLVAGLACGILFNKLIVMLMEKILHFPIVMKTEFHVFPFGTTIILFCIIFCLCLLSNLAKIQLSNPIELLHGQNAGEKEPKTKWFIAIAGFALLGGGYYIANTTESPIMALGMFFIAVVMVIIGTYCLFTAGSIFVLKILKKKKKFYYKTKHFTAVSGMIYRMKQNAVGLANICVLSTMVLVMVSGTVSLYIGVEDVLSTRFPNDITVESKYKTDDPLERTYFIDTMKDIVASSDCTISSLNNYSYLQISVGIEDGKFTFDNHNYSDSVGNIHVLVFFTLDEYNKLSGDNATLGTNEVLVYNSYSKLPASFELFDQTYKIKSEVKDFPVVSDFNSFINDIHYIVVPDIDDITLIYNGQKEKYQDYASYYINRTEVDLNGSNDDKITVFKEYRDQLDKLNENHFLGKLSSECKQITRDDVFGLYGGFLFLGCFLGTLFLMATVLIIYYKQISEGYEDKERFNIMQKVGMSRAEVKKSIHSQVLMVFFLPIVMAALHVLAAFKLISKLLRLLQLNNVALFAGCTAGTVVVFVLIYAIVYSLTARTYYKIVD